MHYERLPIRDPVRHAPRHARAESFELATLHSLAWLCAGSAVGFLLANLLLFPDLGNLLTPFSFGRWIPVHLNAQLYGWCSLPLVGLLFRLYLPRSGAGPWPRIALGVWSASLLFGCATWLSGYSSGKLFLEWTGWSRALFGVSLLLLGVVLTVAWIRQSAEAIPSPASHWFVAGKGAFLSLLLAVPFVMVWAASPKVYPSINPDSGGATGSSLLGSTLGIVVVFLACPLFAGLKPRRRGPIVITLAVLTLHFVGFALLDHGHRSHHEILQIVGLSTLIVWLPLLVVYMRQFDWPAPTRPWLIAFCAWGVFLLATAIPMFLPGILEQWKFTNALVGHAHAAMAGLVTSFLMIVLTVLNRDTAYRTLLAARQPFLLWQFGCAMYVIAFMGLGSIEAVSPGVTFRVDPRVDAVYLMRCMAGFAMLFASATWLWTAVRSRIPQRSRVLRTAPRPRSATALRGEAR